MAEDTPLNMRDLVIYEVYTRNHGPNGTFADVEADLERISALGVDVLWLMPIHPIGQIARKGRLGSPYSISDYRATNPEYGSKADFARLVTRAHALGLKVMIDVVYNHTAHDSILVGAHPNWFHQDEHGRPVTTVPEWSDVIDLKYPNPALETYLIETLIDWAQTGVDGFRCDVASIVPLDFWLHARAALASVKPGIIWLAESVHAGFIEHRRAQGLRAWNDADLYRAFDITYPYDIWPLWQQTVRRQAPTARYIELLRFQEALYPANYAKLRCVENHDQPRIQALAHTSAQALAWTAFEAFNKGPFLIYAGQEAAARHTPTLFDRDPIGWNGYPLADFLSRLTRLKKDPAAREGRFALLASEPVVQAAWIHPHGSLLGLFNVDEMRGAAPVPVADGLYPDLLGGADVLVRGGQAALPESAAIIRCEMQTPDRLAPAPLMDYQYPPE